jgi:hypothetical protein
VEAVGHSTPLRRRWNAAVQWFLERVLGAPPDVTIALGGRPRQHALCIRIETRALWAAEPMSRKARALLRLRWQPSDGLAGTQAIATYRQEIFGGDDDLGDHLGRLYDWHLQRDWVIDALTEADAKRATALASFTVLTRHRYNGLAASSLNLRLGRRSPIVLGLIHPLVAKMPVISLRYFLDLDVHYAFDAVRRAEHPRADHIIGFLYELLFLQQKTAIGMLEYAKLLTYADAHKGSAYLIDAEVDAIMAADALFAYLKASVEKTIALVGAVYGITDVDAKKEHRKRVNALRAGLPPGVEKLPYAEFLFEMVGAEHLGDLNAYRTGLLHKKGIADLQPHNYVGQTAGELPLQEVFGVLHEQHSKNTALLLVALALLTDDLARRDPPPFSARDIPGADMLARQAEAAATHAIERFATTHADGKRSDGQPAEAPAMSSSLAPGRAAISATTAGHSTTSVRPWRVARSHGPTCSTNSACRT